MIDVELRMMAAGKMTSTVSLEEGSTCSVLLDRSGIDRKRTLVVLLNGRYAEPDRELRHGDVVSVFPPVAGG